MQCETEPMVKPVGLRLQLETLEGLLAVAGERKTERMQIFQSKTDELRILLLEQFARHLTQHAHVPALQAGLHTVRAPPPLHETAKFVRQPIQPRPRAAARLTTA